MGTAGKLTLGVILFGGLLGTVCCMVGYVGFTAVLEQQYSDAAYEIAETARSFLNPGRFGRYLATGEADQEYQEVLRRLDALREATNALSIYVAAVDRSDYETVTYIYATVDPGTDLERYPLGYTAAHLDEKCRDDVIKIMHEGGRATEHLYTYPKGLKAYTTAAMDVRDPEGGIAAMIWVEKPMTGLAYARRAYVLSVILWSMGAIVLFGAAYAMILRHNVCRPILAVAREAERFARDTTVSDALLAIGQQDEIGILAQAVGRMEKDITGHMKNLKAITAEKERVNTSASIAAQIQSDMLSGVFTAFPEREEFDIYATVDPAEEAGGDLYDLFMVDERHLAIVMADVSGKGVPAALFMVIAKTLIKERTRPDKDLGEVFTEVNDLLCASNSRGLFIRAFEGVLDLASGAFCFVSAGCERPFVCKKDGRFGYCKIRGDLVLAGLEGRQYKGGCMHLEVGDKIFQYTDGVIQAADKDEEFYGRERLERVLDASSSLPPVGVLTRVKEDIGRFVGDAPLADDITMLCLEYKARAAAG